MPEDKPDKDSGSDLFIKIGLYLFAGLDILNNVVSLFDIAFPGTKERIPAQIKDVIYQSDRPRYTAILVLFSAVVAACMVIWKASQEIRKRDLQGVETPTLSQRFMRTVSIDYKSKDPQHIFLIQFGLRALFVVFVIAPQIFSPPLTAAAIWHHLGILAFWLYSIISYLKYFRRFNPSKNSTIRQFGAWADVGAITFLAILASDHWQSYHMAYVIPIMGIWLIDDLPKKILPVVFVLIAIPYFTNQFGFWATLSAYLPIVVFWAILGLLVIILRCFREALQEEGNETEETHKEQVRELDMSLKQKRDDLTEVKVILDCLHNLGTEEDHAVFAKDRSRRFIFANGVLIERLNQHIVKQGHKLQKIDGSFVSKKHPLQMEDIKGRTDADLFIDRKEYLKSDASVLGLSQKEIRSFLSKEFEIDKADIAAFSKQRQADHFHGFEPGFDDDTGSRKAIWTIKHSVRDGEEVIGLVGETVKGLPIQMEALAHHLNESMQVFALMKEWDGKESRIAWCNESHFKKLESRINELAREQNLELSKDIDTGALLLQRLNEGRGPTDRDLYGGVRVSGSSRLWEHYPEDDREIINRASGLKKDSDELYQTLRKWVAKEKGEENYPTNGWVERHRYPGSEELKWVEVRKWPWFEGGRVKGVLVLFQEVHESYMRRHIVWRWTKRHIPLAVGATEKYLEENVKKAKDAPNGVSLLKLENKMLQWLRGFIDDPKGSHRYDTIKRSTDELKVLVDILKHLDSACPVNLELPISPWNIKFWGQEFFGIAVVLLINAGEATVRAKNQRKAPASFSLFYDDVHDLVVMKVADRGDGFEEPIKERVHDILEGFYRTDKKKKYLETPGGGLLMVKGILRGMWKGHKNSMPRDWKWNSRTEFPDEALTMEARGGRASAGATVTVSMPRKALSNDKFV